MTRSQVTTEPRTGLTPRRPHPPLEHTMTEPQPAPVGDVIPVGLMTDQDIYLFNEGTHYRLATKMGSHRGEYDGHAGVYFGVWAPAARYVSVIGDFNGWDRGAHPLRPRGQSGVWEGFIPGLGEGALYKYFIASQFNGYGVEKADPFAFEQETPPGTASRVRGLEYRWDDAEWMEHRARRNALDAPMSIYEVHLGSWRRLHHQDNRPLTYQELAAKLIEHLRETGFTHVEFLPVMEHPFYGSWGYQTTGYFAPTSRYGTPQDFMSLIDQLHQAGYGVILDWVPSHFPTDEHGLMYFDGTHLYEHADPRQGFHPDWKSAVFNYGRNEVRAFLISSACHWLETYHADGLRVDAVASMLYLDYSRRAGEWVPNRYGGRENLEAIDFLRRLNTEVYRSFPGIQVIAEESTAWPMVSRPVHAGGLGFGLKWDMGWMHDTLRYMSKDPVHRRHHHNDLTFRGMYAWTENFVLPLSHDEVVHGKGSLLAKMAGADAWQKFANMRLLLCHQWSQPGKKLLFMGGEFAQGREWNHDEGLDWGQLEIDWHAGVMRLVSRLNELYRELPALHELDCDPAGFQWLTPNDAERSTLAFLRRGRRADDVVLCALNFTPEPRHNERYGVPCGGRWEEILNSDALEYGGSGQGNLGGVEASPIGLHGMPWSVTLTLPPLGAVFLRGPREQEPATTAGSGRGGGP